MRKAAEDDSIARSEERPAVSKLKLLPQVLADIVKPKWVHLFLKEGVCDELARYVFFFFLSEQVLVLLIAMHFFLLDG
jgi:hypothetical protein